MISEKRKQYLREWRQRNRDKVKGYARKTAKSPTRKKWLAANREKLSAYHHQWEVKNAAHVKSYKKRWYENRFKKEGKEVVL